MKQKLLNSLRLRLCLLVATLLCVGGKAWGEEAVYKTALFGEGHNSKNQSYTGSFDATNEGFVVTAVAFNNNQNGWNGQIKCGRKGEASTGIITTKAAIDQPITKVSVTINAITADYVTSIKLYTSANSTSWTEAGSFTKSTGVQSVTLTNPTANLYYKIEFVCKSAKSNGVVAISKVEYYYDNGGSTVETCATPTFSPAEGTYTEAQNVTISTTTDGATIYYTTDGSEPTTSSSVYNGAINVSSNTTIKAIAVKEGINNSAVAEADYIIRQAVIGYVVNFENELEDYVDWTFTNAEKSNSEIGAHGGEYFATTGGKQSASIQTKEKVAYPDVFTCYVSKTSNNTTSSTWKVQVSSDGSSWTDIGEAQSATTMAKGEWVEYTADIKAAGYTNVYVRLYYTGSTAVRTVDDISLTTYTPAAVETPSITVPEEFTFTTTATITCVTEGATIYYSYDNSTWTEYTDALTLTETKTIYAKATKGGDESAVAQATATKVLATAEVAISSTSINVGETATVTTNGPAVTLSTSDAAVASVDGTTVTGIAEGTATITATWSANNDYAAGTKEFDVTVADPNAPGQQSNPYTVAQAIEATPASGSTDNVYIHGIVSAFYNNGESILSDGNNYRYYISDDGNTTTQLLVYKGKGLGNVAFANANDLKIGDEVVIYGKLTTYSNAPEINSGNYIVSRIRPSHTVTFSIDGNTTTAEVEEDAAITFPTNPDDISGKTFVGWTTTEIETETDTRPALVTEATMGTADVTYYAVFATTEGEGSATATLTSANIKTSYVAPNGYANRSITDEDGNTWNAYAMSYQHSNATSDYYYLQIKKSDNNESYYIQVPTFGTKITQLVMTVSGASQPMTDGGNTSTVFFSASNSTSAEGEGVVSGTGDASITLDCSSLNLNTGYITAGGAVRIWDVTVTYSDVSYSGYCTTVPYVTVGVMVGATGFATFSCDKALDFTGIENIYAYTATVSGKEISFTRVYQVPANTGLLLRNPAEEAATANVPVIASAAAIENNALVAVNEEIAELASDGEDGSKNYILNKPSGKNVGFFLAAGKKVGANKAYLKVPAGVSAVKSFAEIFDGETDGVEAIENGQWTIDNAVIYNLAGQRLQKLQRGVNIVGGKKVVVK